MDDDDLTFEEFLARLHEEQPDTEDDIALAVWAFVGKQRPPADPLDLIVWERAVRYADLECGRALPLSERDQARVEATMLGLPFDESAQLPPSEMPVDDPDSDDPATSVAVMAALMDMMGEPLSEAAADELLETAVLQGIEYATSERERWASASDRLHAWFAEVIAKLAERH